MGRLFSIQIFDHSATFDCRDILDAEKGMLEVYQKRPFIEIDTNLRIFLAILSNVVSKENAYYWFYEIRQKEQKSERDLENNVVAIIITSNACSPYIV